MKMKAWVLEQTAPVEEHPLVMDTVTVPDPGPDDVLIEVGACGLCHTDIHVVEGELALPQLPVIPGHQVVGKIVGNGTNVKNAAVGERVGVPWLSWTCGECRYCKAGLENLCTGARFTGFHENGGYAEYMVAPAEFVYPIPKEFDDVHAAPLLCAGIIGYRALRLSGIFAKAGDTLGLFGFGASAHIAIQIAANKGARVFVFTRSAEHRKHAKSLGAVWVGSADDTPPEPLSAAISFAPAGDLIPKAMEKLDKGATLALAGIYVGEMPKLDYQKHIFHEKQLRSVTASTREDARELLKAAAKVPVKTDVTVYPFEKANEALCDLKASRINGAAVLKIR